MTKTEKPDYADSEWAKKMVLLDKKIDRPGAGRPAKPKSEHRQTITIRLSPDLYKQVQLLPRNMKGAWIESAIKEKLEKTPNQKDIELSIEDIGLTLRTIYCLKDNGILFVRELVCLGEAELLRTPGLGRKSLSEIKERLAEKRLKLKCN